MKSTNLVTAIAISALFAIGTRNALAADIVGGENWVQFNHVASTKTRAQVMKELKADRAQVTANYNEETDYPRIPMAKMQRSRDEVRSEAATAAKDTLRLTDYSSGQ